MLPTDLFLGSPGLPGSTMKLTPGVGMTLLIGVAGSIFLVAQSHRLLRSKLSQRRRSSRKPDVAECYMCNANVELESTDSFATCRGCERLVCRGENCCQWVESIGIWECTGCQSNRVIQQKAGEWLLNQLTARLQQPGPVELRDGNLLGLGLDADDARSTSSSTVSANQRIKVREFIEELLSAMLHGPLDDVSVGQLMKHESYIRLFRKFHTRLSRCLYNLELSIHHSLMSDLPLWEGQQQHHSPSDQHFELKRLIQKILEEIAKLPELLNHSGLPLRPEEHLPYFDPKKYEQLVATAVLNKVVDDYRNPKNFPSAGDVAAKPYYVAGGGGGGGGPVDVNHNQLTEGGSHPKGALNAEALRQMSVTADEILAHEAAAASYSASGDRRLSDTDESYLSDYIQRHKVPLPDLSDTTTGSGSGAEDDDLQSLKSNATDGTWEENWLFRKRQLKTTESSIAMLVPSPTEEVKALIGDKNADEISDLSEAGSDCEGYESDSNVAPEVIKSEASPLTAGSSSKDETSEGLSSSSKPQDSLEEENFPADSLVSISSLPANEEALSEAKNSQLLGEQDRSAGTILEDLISIGPVVEKVETTNPTLTNPFLNDPFEVNNGVITDDVKLLQRTEASDNRSSEPSTNGHGDRKEIPIDRVPPLLLLDSLSPPGSPVQQVLSPHPIMMTITDVFDRMASSSPLGAISEELPPPMLMDPEDSDPPFGVTPMEESFDQNSSPLTTISEELSATVQLEDGEKGKLSEEATPDAVLSPMDSIQDDSEYRTVSEATNNSLMLVESFEELGPFSMSDMPHDSNSLQRCDEEFSSIVEQSESDNAEEQEQRPIVTAQSSPDLLQIRETPPAAVYVRDQEQREFSEQLKTLNAPNVVETPNRNPFQDEEGDTDKPSQITLHADLVTFDNNIPSPERNPGIVAVTEQMRAYCEELKGILNRPSAEEGLDVKPVEEELDQWEMVEPPEALEALDAFGEELQRALEDPTVSEVSPCKDHPIREYPLLELEEPFPSPIEIGSLRMAEYSESLKNIEYVEEALAMDEQVQIISDTSVEMEERSSEAFTVSSPEPSHHSVTVHCTPSIEDPPSQMEVPSSADEATESFPLPSTSTEETMLASIESRSESKIDDTSMPFSDSDLPSLSSPHTTTTTIVTASTTTTINNCMSTNITDQVSTPICISTSTIDIDTNPSNNTRFVSELSLDVPLSLADAPPQTSIVADSSIIPAQKTAEQQPTVESNGHHTEAVPADGGMDEQNQPSLDEADTLIPGSIAEREHLKWRNAKPIANNPYSPDALQRRLSEKSRPSSMIEIERLVKKDAAPNGSAVVLLDDEDSPKEPVDSGTENDRSLQSVMGGALSEKKKIGREYYINDPERLRAGGGVLKQTLGVEQKQPQQLSHSTDDEKSLLLARNVDDGESNQLKLAPGSGTSLSRSSSFGKPRDPGAENVFAARPVQVTSDDPILKKGGTKVNHLSTAAREAFLVPVEPEPHGSLISSSSEVSINSPTSSSGARPELDSLTYSEDSDVTRIYDLTTGEAKVFRSGVPAQSETILQILPQLPSPVHRASACPSPAQAPSLTAKPSSPIGGQDERGFLRPAQFAVKPLSPETIKFFAPKRKLSFTGSSSNLATGEGTKTPATSSPGHTMHSSLHIDFPATRATNGSEFSIIERDVIDVLPSVKELAKCYSGSCSEVSTMPPKPLYKPRVKLRKDFLRQSSDVLNEDGSSGAMPDAGTKGQRQYSSTSSIAVRDEIREIRKINLEAYRQQSTFYPMAPGHSITARSLSKQIREHKTNVTDDHKVGQHEELPGSNGGNGGGGGEGDGVGSGIDGGHASPERPSSPVFLPGHLKTSIEFFESLRNKP
ncbi:uncharacterized protein LOC131282403 [Anopheles ziemanni]|uniref:uncharacterized protein LOC131266891 n=1 Tax=Anopheles coustani TaxID=139045 RepID=UPI00265945F4|nr:uncharacterized protein LOC131266891 [Anopheles coustani]XP_058167841.1 uncharacterized protein LOC131282403 [Anopheles ziemanni]